MVSSRFGRSLRISLQAILFALCLLALPATAHADVNDFTITSFTGNYVLDRSDPQGRLTIDEKLTVAFTDNNHGILRALPERYNGEAQRIKVLSVARDGASEQFTTYSSNRNLVLKIGSPSLTVTGSHQYEIKYTVQNVIRFTAEHDELDWNTNGLEWSQPFEQVTASFSAPADLASKVTNQACSTGALGSQAHDCTLTTNGPTTQIASTRTLEAGETMTYSADFPKGTFTPPTFVDMLHDSLPLIIAVAGPPLLAIFFLFPYWLKNGKDLKGQGTIIPEYGPPAGLSPIECDVVAHYKLSNKGISATIIDLAIRKYIKIIESDKKSVLGFGGGKQYTLQLLNKDFSALNPYENQILSAIFSAQDTVDIATLKNQFYITAQALQKQVPDGLSAKGYFSKNPKKAGAALHGIGIAFIFFAFFIRNTWSIGLILAGIISISFGFLMPKRSAQGTAVEDALKGLKMYMEVAEKDRIAMLQSPNSPYANKTDAPQQTVELFEKLLPYAIILGVEQQWAKQFESIYTTPPDWYSGNWASFNTGYLVGSLSGSLAAMNTSFAAPSSSGSGGGFAGGGGGGGGW